MHARCRNTENVTLGNKVAVIQVAPSLACNFKARLVYNICWVFKLDWVAQFSEHSIPCRTTLGGTRGCVGKPRGQNCYERFTCTNHHSALDLKQMLDQEFQSYHWLSVISSRCLIIKCMVSICIRRNVLSNGNILKQTLTILKKWFNKDIFNESEKTLLKHRCRFAPREHKKNLYEKSVYNISANINFLVKVFYMQRQI